MPWAMPPCTWPSTIIGLMMLAEVVDGEKALDLHLAGIGVDLRLRRCASRRGR